MASTFSDDLNLFSGQSGGATVRGCLKGNLAEVYLWGVALQNHEVDVVVRGFDLAFPSASYMRGYYALEEGQGVYVSDFMKINSVGYLGNGAAWSLDSAPLSGWQPRGTRNATRLPFG